VDQSPNSGESTAVADEPLLRTVDLTRHFRLGGMLGKKQILHAVDDFNMTIGEREIVALVGESGSGKSTVARLLARVYPPTRGEIYYRGRPLRGLRFRKDLLAYRGEVTMVFQDPFSAFSPVFRISHGVMRSLALHRPELNRAERRQEAERAFESVGLNPKMLRRFPYEMSGGERQRVGFAQALAVRPKLILADEPVSMLDVSIRIGVLNMMAGLRDREGVSLLYITHDLASARYVADRIIVMYAGHLVEEGPTETVLSDPKHPYTQLLLSAVADQDEKEAGISADTGEPPRVINPSEGCRFRWRCPYAIEKCAQVTPRPTPIGSTQVACHVAVAEAQAGSKPTGAAQVGNH
jgi:peptide/nickel transport system ATP-binding protein